MGVDRKLLILGVIEFSLALLILGSAVVFQGRYRLWEVFPVFLSAAITTLGLREMRRRT